MILRNSRRTAMLVSECYVLILVLLFFVGHSNEQEEVSENFLLSNNNTVSTDAIRHEERIRKNEIAADAELQEPESGQIVRLRKGIDYNTGIVEVFSESKWKGICESFQWDIKDANVVCKQMGFTRGAEFLNMTETNDPNYSSNPFRGLSNFHCQGNESSILHCSHQKSLCATAAKLTCFRNRAAFCNEGEESFMGSCYRFVKEPKTHEEARLACLSQNSRIITIDSQQENDFLSERLQHERGFPKWYGGGWGVGTFWMWEIQWVNFHSFMKWFSGWKTGLHSYVELATPIGPRCLTLQNEFLATNDIQKTTDYFFWGKTKCGEKLPYICERPHKQIGCIEGIGEYYTDKANVTRFGQACLPWDTPNLPIFVGKTVFNETMRGHNYCRNPDADAAPWCYYTLNKYEFCDIPTCQNYSDDRKLETLVDEVDLLNQMCRDDQFRCPSGLCIEDRWICDGENDCFGGEDEASCRNYLLEFTNVTQRKFSNEEVKVLWYATLETCARYCMETREITCKSFAHSANHSRCYLSDQNRGTGINLYYNEEFNYYERTTLAVTDCQSSFVCDNGKCISKNLICNHQDDCGDGSDEKLCDKPVDFSIRLSNGTFLQEGRVEVRVNGQWGTVCDDYWDMLDAEVVCRQLGHKQGALKATTQSFFGNGNGSYLMDRVRCHGNETSLALCPFTGWGKHNCFEGETAGVICKVSSKGCDITEFKCGSGECILMAYLCDGDSDCADESDEKPEECTDYLQVRLVNGSSPLSGRVEVRRFGVWGTICDDGWDEADAQVICRSLGYAGPAQAHGGSHFGSGEGPIWLDEVHCFGLEQSLEECEKTRWLKHDCTHYEDVGVTCDYGANLTGTPSSLEALLPKDCGTRLYEDDPKDVSYRYAKIIGGAVATQGAYPWQANVRIEKKDKTVLWCGATIITEFFALSAAHCFDNDGPTPTIIRVGDYNDLRKDVGEEDFEILRTIIHERFNHGQKLNNDIALVEVKPKNGRGFQFGPYVRPACLPKFDTRYTPGTECVISGWGSTGLISATRLQAVRIPILSRSTCSQRQAYGPSKLTAGMFCAGVMAGGVDSCNGDSGGPFICKVNDRYSLLGIISWGHGCAKPNKPGIYATVRHYLDWIYTHLAQSTK